MPFQSKAQMRFMFAKHPDIAKRWARTYGVPKNMPEHKGSRGNMHYEALKKKGRKK